MSGVSVTCPKNGVCIKNEYREQALYLARLKGLEPSGSHDPYQRSGSSNLAWKPGGIKGGDPSKGMSQKLQFVTTVLHEPSLIILDEPFSGLDPVNANLIKDEIFALAKKRKYDHLQYTHRMEQVEEICDHIALINKGKRSSTVRYSRLSNNSRKKHIPHRCEHTARTPDDTGLPGGETQSNEMLLKLTEGSQPNDVLSHFIRQGVQINSFQEVLPSLGTIFSSNWWKEQQTARQFQPIND